MIQEKILMKMAILGWLPMYQNAVKCILNVKTSCSDTSQLSFMKEKGWERLEIQMKGVRSKGKERGNVDWGKQGREPGS
jgi:hypothetical protein